MDVVRVECIQNTDPRYVRVYVSDVQSYDIPYTFYDIIREPLGLPHVICD